MIDRFAATRERLAREYLAAKDNLVREAMNFVEEDGSLNWQITALIAAKGKMQEARRRMSENWRVG